jgi:predicted ribosome-associated RNA-binding protein Tma20
MKVIFTKDNFHVFFQIKKKKKQLYESHLYKRQLSRVFSNFKKIYTKLIKKKNVKVVFCEDNFHLIRENCLL